MGDIWGKLWTRYIRILFTLLKSFVLEAVRGFFFCYCVNLSRGTWQQNTSFQIEPKVSNIKTSFTRAKLSSDYY